MASPPADGDRDRDSDGRPRNARARDELGRPMPRTGESSSVPEPPILPPAEALAAGQRLLDEGRPFEAHELFEAVWKATAPPEREVWRALAQLAVGITHARRGNAAGARALLQRTSDTMARFAGTTPHGIDVDGVSSWARRAADDLALTSRPPRLGRGNPGSGSEGAGAGAISQQGQEPRCGQFGGGG